jgi:hypothetical protein
MGRIVSCGQDNQLGPEGGRSRAGVGTEQGRRGTEEGRSTRPGAPIAAASQSAERCQPAPLVLPFINTVTHQGRRGARIARREEEEYRE